MMEEEEVSKREQVFRLARIQCQRCDGQSILAAVVGSPAWSIWCPECIVKACVQGMHLQVDDYGCGRCGKQSYLYYMVFWMNRQQRWCEECVMETLPRQIERQNARI